MSCFVSLLSSVIDHMPGLLKAISLCMVAFTGLFQSSGKAVFYVQYVDYRDIILRTLTVSTVIVSH